MGGVKRKVSWKSSFLGKEGRERERERERRIEKKKKMEKRERERGKDVDWIPGTKKARRELSIIM